VVIGGTTTLGSFQPIELPDGRIVTIGTDSEVQYVLVSADHGATWKPASAALPFQDPRGVAYSSQRKAFYLWRFSCGNGSVPVPSNAVMRFDFDYKKN
jgi:hypothetical protein